MNEDGAIHKRLNDFIEVFERRLEEFDKGMNSFHKDLGKHSTKIKKLEGYTLPSARRISSLENKLDHRYKIILGDLERKFIQIPIMEVWQKKVEKQINKLLDEQKKTYDVQFIHAKMISKLQLPKDRFKKVIKLKKVRK